MENNNSPKDLLITITQFLNIIYIYPYNSFVIILKKVNNYCNTVDARGKSDIKKKLNYIKKQQEMKKI